LPDLENIFARAGAQDLGKPVEQFDYRIHSATSKISHTAYEQLTPKLLSVLTRRR